MNHCIFLFTRANEIFHMSDLAVKTIEGFVRRTAGDEEIYRSVGNRIVGVENVHTTPYEEQLQRKRLIAYLQCMVDRQEIKAFTNKVFEEAKERREKNIKDRIDREVDEAVSKNVENKMPAELAELAQGNYDEVVNTIMKQHEGLSREMVVRRVKWWALLLTDISFLEKLKEIGMILFAAAGCLVRNLIK